MFYFEDDINVLKICPLCKEELNDPRILPCSQTVCQDCIKAKGNFLPSQSYHCQNCNKDNTIRSFGFIKKEIAALLVKKNNVTKFIVVKKLKN
jgi:hypothetical protein